MTSRRETQMHEIQSFVYLGVISEQGLVCLYVSVPFQWSILLEIVVDQSIDSQAAVPFCVCCRAK